MTTSPDTVNVADATTLPPPLAVAATDQAVLPTSPATGGATRTQLRPTRPDMQEEPSSTFQRVLVGVFVAVPLLALLAAIPLLWGWGLGWHDVVIALVFYWVSGLGITVGYHRYFTHGSFKAKTGLRVALAIAGSLAIEGPVIGTGMTGRRCPRGWSTRTSDGSSTPTRPRRRSSLPTCSPTSASRA
jgi:cation transport ATPase